MKVLSIDPGSANVGLAVLEDEKLLYCTRLNYMEGLEGAFNEKLYRVLCKLYLELARIIHKYEVTHVAVEIVPAIGGMNFKDFVTSTGAIVKALSYQYELTYQGIGATSVKLQVAGSGRAKKDAIRDRIIELYPNLQADFGIKDGAFDAFDAVAIGLAAQAKAKWVQPTSSSFTGRDW